MDYTRFERGNTRVAQEASLLGEGGTLNTLITHPHSSNNILPTHKRKAIKSNVNYSGKSHRKAALQPKRSLTDTTGKVELKITGSKEDEKTRYLKQLVERAIIAYNRKLWARTNTTAFPTYSTQASNKAGPVASFNTSFNKTQVYDRTKRSRAEEYDSVMRTNPKRQRIRGAANLARQFQIQETDVFASKKSSPGNDLFVHLLSTYKNSDDRNSFVDEIIGTIHAQDPPGRFLSPDRKSVLVGAAEQMKVLFALQNRIRKLSKSKNADAATDQEDKEKASKASDPEDASAGKSNPVVTHDNDVLGGVGMGHRKNVGNALYRELIAHHVRTDDLTRSVDEIIAVIKSQIPPGRFLSTRNDMVLIGTAETVKVYNAMNNAIRMANKKDGEAAAYEHSLRQGKDPWNC